MVKFTKAFLLASIAACLVLPFAVFVSLAAENLDSSADPSGYSDDWRSTGPQGGDVRKLVVDPQDPLRFYFGTLDGQIYTSTDGGKRWSLLYNFHRPKMFVDELIVDPRNSKILYAAGHRHKESGGFFKSVDGGRTWRESMELRNEAVHSLSQSPSNPDVLIVGTFNTMFRSNDSGDTWVKLPTHLTQGLVHVSSLAIDPRTPSTIYAGTWYLPYKTNDGGQTWKSIKTGIIDDSDIFAIDIDPRDPTHIILSACSGIYESKNSGESWRKVQGIPSQSRRTRAILQHPSVPGLVFAGTTEGFWRSDRGGAADSWMVTTSRQLEINSIAVHPQRPEMVFIGTNNYGVMVSSDSGKTFAPTNVGYSGRFANAILPDRETPNRIYAATINTATGGGFLFISNDNGETWRPSMRNMPSRLITYAILQDSQNADIIYLGTNLGIYRSVDRGASWAPIWAESAKSEPAQRKAAARTARRGRQAPVSRANTSIKEAQEALVAAGYRLGVADGKVGKLTIAAIRAYQADKHLPVTGKFDALTLAALGVSQSTSETEATGPSVVLTTAVNSLVHTVDSETGTAGFLAATNAGLYRSLDPLKGWQKLPYTGGAFDSRTTTVSTLTHLPDKIWVGTISSGVLKTEDGGETWRQVGGVPTEIPINVIVQDPKRPHYLYVGTKQAFFASQDNGLTWTRRGGNLPFGDFTSIVINPHNNDEIFVGNAYQSGKIGGGVYRTLNAGLTWARIDPGEHGIPSQRIWSLAFDLHDQNTLFVGSHSAGVYVVPRQVSGLSAASQ